MRVRWERIEVAPKHPFRISRSTQTRVCVVWLRLECDGLEGWGEADPAAYYGETADTVEAALGALRQVLERADDPEGLERLERELRRVLGGNGAAHAAVSAALHDLVGKRLGRPLWRLWGLDPATAPSSSFTIGIDEPRVVVEKAREAAAYPILKLKVGTDGDEEMVAAVRDVAPESRLRVDANAGWRPRQAVERIAMLAGYGVELVEQPLPPEDREGLRFVHARSALPIVLDESCITAADVPGLLGLADGINIKLAKCGGPREALRMIHAARACGLGVMMGCMLETTLGIAAAAHLAPLLDWADLDGAALLRDDPFEGPGIDATGRIVLSNRPGLGVERRTAG